MPVVGAGGLVGQVVAGQPPHRHRAPDHRRAVAVGRPLRPAAGSLAVLSGQGAGKPLTADLVPTNTPLADGEVFTTSGLAGRRSIPPGIPVAQVVVGAATGSTASQESVTCSRWPTWPISATCRSCCGALVSA